MPDAGVQGQGQARSALVAALALFTTLKADADVEYVSSALTALAA